MQKQRQTLNHKLNLSPQQIQFLNLLQIPIVDLDKRIEREIEENPAIEEEESQENESEKSYLNNNNYGNKKTDFIVDNYTGKSNTLANYLHNQLIGSEINNEELNLIKYLIDSLDENGFLRRNSSSIINDYYLSTEFEVSKLVFDNALIKLKELEPIGVGSKDLQECLIIQNNKSEFENKKLINSVLANYYVEFSNKNFEKIIKELNISKDELAQVYKNIERFHPIPGAGFSKEKTELEFIIPDFTVVNKEGSVEVRLNKTRKRNINISHYYKNLLSETKDEKTKDFLKQKLEKARWFIESLEAREKTLLNVMETIVDIQKDYFLSGEEMDLKPMKLADIAEKIHLDISTISRVTNSKYVEVNFGTFLLKDFFSEAYRKDNGDLISTKEIKSKLVEIIGSEDKENPLTDEKLCGLLGENEYHIARRTVSKYRDELNIPTAKKRRAL